MQIYKSLFIFSLCVFVIGVHSCSEFDKSAESTINLKTLDWAKRTSFKQDFNDEYAYVEVLKQSDKSLVTMILDGVESGEVKAYHFFDKKQMSSNDIDQLFHPKDTVSVFNIDLGKEVITPTVGELNRSAIKNVRIEQEWYFNKKEFTMKSKVTAIAPMETIYNTDGSVRGDSPLFWVFLN